MIRSSLFLFGFLVGFSMDIRVEAGERVQLIPILLEKEQSRPLSSALLEEPVGCLRSKSECALRIGARRRLQLEPTKERTWVFGEETIFIRLSDSRIRFVEGSVKLHGAATIVETELGEVTVSDEAFLERQGDNLVIVNTGHDPVLVRGRGWSSEHEVPSGLEVSLDLPDVKTGKTSANLPLPLDFDRQVVREAKLFDGAKADFPARLEAIVALRTKAAEVSSKIHRELAERKLASVEAKESELRKRRALREAKDSELRALFRRKTLNPE